LILKADAKQLEWRVKAYLSRDPIAIEEILAGVDMHSVNQAAFGLPSRLIAKVYVFRQIFADAFSEMGFRRPAYAYANDVEFMAVSPSVKFWTKVTEEFYHKYKGMYQHGLNLIEEVYRTGKVVNPTGRAYEFSLVRNRRGEPDLPRTQILNYPVQGLAAELMCLARVVLRKRLIKQGYYRNGVLLINTVHDDIELDVDNNPELIYNISIELENLFNELPKLFEEYYGVEFDVPLAGEVSYGPNLKDLKEFKREENIII
jgi:DNA polymerase I-like protein with 3'-5' exonuclease and polymerase domains